jgi:hypothetical protein
MKGVLETKLKLKKAGEGGGRGKAAPFAFQLT